MRILYAVHHLPPRYTGGAEARALRTARRMQALGHEAAMICVEAIDQREPAVETRVEEGIPIRRLSFDHRSFPEATRWTYDNAFVEDRVTELLNEQRPDVFHLISGYLMTAGAIRAAHRRGIPIVITLTDFWFLCPRITLLRGAGRVCPAPPPDPLGCVQCQAEASRRFSWPAQVAPQLTAQGWRQLGQRLPAVRAQALAIHDRRQVLSEALALSQALICPSRFLRELFVENGVAPEKLLLMRQGLAVPDQQPPRRPADDVTVFGYSGQIKPHKGVDLIVAAGAALAARGYRFKIAIYGNAEEDRRYTESLKRRARAATWLEWRGTYTAHDAWTVLAGLDAILVPSRWYENSPNIILEAQAAGVPVIATELGGMAELVRHEENGLLFRLNDAADLSRQMSRLLGDPGLLIGLRDCAPPVKTLDQEMAELLQLYGQVIGRA
ncbi:MAG TPA: glycosyltransferase family 4 protein [Anaerolineae bacterium]|nr:glycosyltransferase family 4 protein [Anaerolineae bacterium]